MYVYYHIYICIHMYHPHCCWLSQSFFPHWNDTPPSLPEVSPAESVDLSKALTEQLTFTSCCPGLDGFSRWLADSCETMDLISAWW